LQRNTSGTDGAESRERSSSTLRAWPGRCAWNSQELPRHGTRKRAQADRARRPRPRALAALPRARRFPLRLGRLRLLPDGNHFHLVVETPVPNLARGMRELNGLYAPRFNRRCGHLFGGFERGAAAAARADPLLAREASPPPKRRRARGRLSRGLLAAGARRRARRALLDGQPSADA
jgi:hypothetical protein